MHIFLIDVSIFLACNLAYLWVSWWTAIRDESRGNWKQSGLSYASGDYISTEECCMERKTWRFKMFLFSWDYMSGFLQQYHTVACCHLIFLLYLFQFYVYLVSMHCFAIRWYISDAWIFLEPILKQVCNITSIVYICIVAPFCLFTWNLFAFVLYFSPF